MKRRVWAIIITAGVLLGLWFGLVGRLIVRWRQNNASVDMMVATNRLEQYVLKNGEWPRSWQELFPEGLTSPSNQRDVSSTVSVNWQASFSEIDTFVKRSIDHHYGEDWGVPVLVQFTDRVPRNKDLDQSEQRWNWDLATRIFKAQYARTKSNN